jgi:hypothetical protein
LKKDLKMKFKKKEKKTKASAPTTLSAQAAQLTPAPTHCSPPSLFFFQQR